MKTSRCSAQAQIGPWSSSAEGETLLQEMPLRDDGLQAGEKPQQERTGEAKPLGVEPRPLGSFSGNPTATLYDLVGAETLARLVTAFYDRVAKDPHLAPIFPDDFTLIREKQYRFLTQFFGGPPLYSEVYGHPRLRARHLPFPITPTRARAWMACMKAAMDDIGMDRSLQALLLDRLGRSAVAMINTPEEEDNTEEAKGDGTEAELHR